MVTIRHLISNVSSGQSSLQVRYILNALNDFYNRIKTGIKITYAKPELDGTLVYFKIPSEHTEKLVYDVVVYFETDGRISLETPVRIYSNSPGFAYNFAYVLHQHKSLLFQEEYPDAFLKMAPKVRNPLGTKAFDKHVYSALKVIGSRKSTLESLSDQFDTVIEPTVKSFKDKEQEIKHINQK
jgi:hypothetical protein